MRAIKKGATDQSVVIRIVDATDGTPETGVVYNTSGIDLWYRREGATKTSITEASLSALDDAHTDGGILHIGDGYYRVDTPDAAFASGANGVMIGGAVTGMIVIGCYVHLVDYDPQDAVRAGLTALPNAAANATGGLMTVKRGGTAQAGASSSITLDAGASSSDDFYIGDLIVVLSGTGAGQSRIITDYVGSTKVATVDAAWTTNPSSDSVFVLIPQGIVGVTDTDVADAVLGATASSYDDAGTIGEKINDAGSAGDPWSTALPGSYGSGTAGKIVGDNLNATVSSRATQTSVDTVDGIVDAILEDTGTTLPGTLSTIDGKVDTIDSNVDAVLEDTGTTLPAALTTITNYVDTIPADILDASNGVETGMTLRQAMRIALSVLAGKNTVSGGSVVFRDVNDTKNRVSATVDGDDQRTAVTLDAS